MEFLYPSKCPLCGELSDGICQKCRKRYPVVGEPRCMKCGKPIQKDTEEYCYDCGKMNHSYDQGKNLWIHQGAVSEAVYAFKYKNKRIYGEIFARELAKYYGKYLQDHHVTLILPIPLHKSRRRTRGYNQAEILARHLGDYTQIDVDCSSLVRVKKTAPQKQFNDKERKKNIKNAFALRAPINAKCVVLIDDIYTTGSTLDEATKVLKKSGVSKVYFLTISVGQGY